MGSTSSKPVELSRSESKAIVRADIAQLCSKQNTIELDTDAFLTKEESVQREEPTPVKMPYTKYGFSLIDSYDQITKEFIIMYKSKINFTTLSRNKHLTDDIIETFVNELDLELIYENKLISLELASKLIGDYNVPCEQQNVLIQSFKFSDETIKRLLKTTALYSYKDAISRHQDLSEEMLYSHQSRLNWNLVCRYQKLTLEFIDKNPKLIRWNELSYNKNLDKTVAEKYLDKLLDTEEVSEALKR